MSRCGCSRGGSGGVLVAGPGLDISGDGTPQRPRTIEVVADPHVCDIAETCMTRSLCRGLSYDGSCIGVDISNDEGNQLGLEADGLYGSCDEVLLCGVTVDNITKPVRGVTFGAGSASGPAFAAAYERGISLGMTMSMAFPTKLQDGVWIFPLYPPSSQYANPTSSLAWREIDSASARSILFTDDQAYAQAPVRGPSTVDEIVRITRGRQVVALTAPHQASSLTEGTVQELVDVVARYCDQRGVVITGLNYTAADRAFLAAARSSGMDTGLYLTGGSDFTTHPPATVAAEGIKWVFFNQASASITDAMITAYRDAGLNIVMTRVRLRTEYDRAVALGAGVLSDAPGYVYGKLCTSTTDPWAWSNWDPNQIGTGQIVRSAWSGEMGASLLASPWAGSPTPGWRFPDELNGRLTGATLLGWARPLNLTTDYTITWEQSWAQLDGARRNANNFGLIIACTDDALPISTDQRSGPATGDGRINGYVLAHAVGDPAAPASTFMEITKINRGAAAGPKVSATGTSNLPVDAWVRLRAVVTPTTITFQRLNADNSVAYQAVMTDGAYRGAYMWVWKNQGETPGGARFRTAYRNLTIT